MAHFATPKMKKYRNSGSSFKKSSGAYGSNAQKRRAAGKKNLAK
jgi:hypothetical protein